MVNKQREIIIEYRYPDLGAVQVQLQNESANIFEFLSSKGEIECFEKLDQLGALRSVHKSSHHSRWECMVLQLYLVEEIRKKKVFGLSTSVPLTKKIIVSSIEELVKSWILLSNYGHLYDTLEAERVWLELVLTDKKLPGIFMDCMPDEQSKAYTRKVLEKEDLFDFHRLISLVLIKRLYRTRPEANAEFVKWTEIVKALLRDMLPSTRLKEGSKLDRAINIFNTIRRVSYVLLDINRSTLFLRVDSNNLLRTILREPESLLYDPNSELNKSIDNMVRLLFSEVYASEEACKFKRKYVIGQKQRFYQKRGKIIKDKKTLANSLYQFRMHNMGNYETEEVLNICRITSLPLDVFERCDCLFHKEQKELKAKAGIKADFLITPAIYSSGGSILDVFAGENLGVQEYSKLFRAIMEYLTKCYDEWLVEDGTMNFVMSKPVEELFAKILSIFVNQELIIRFAEGTSIRDYHIDFIGGGVKRRNWFIGMSSELRNSGLGSSRNWEVRKMVELLRRQKGDTFLICESNVHLYNKIGVREVEWDGVFIKLERKKTVLYVLEAKRGTSRRSMKCRDALSESIIKAGIKLKKSVRIIPCKGYAYTKIDIKDLG
jgi:hypothetical protein